MTVMVVVLGMMVVVDIVVVVVVAGSTAAVVRAFVALAVEVLHCLPSHIGTGCLLD